jgi:drug/metabolite transporter (DMT)-like permease
MPGATAILANDALLILTAAIWGFAFVAQRAGMAHVGPFTYTAVRFALGSLALVPLVLQRRSVSKSLPAEPARIHPVAAGLVAGAVLFGGAILQQLGLVTTTAGKAGFITGLYVVLVPLAGMLWGHRPGWLRWAGAVLAAAGLYLLGVTGAFTVDRGDLLVLAGALFWAAHVMLLGYLSPRTDVVALACVQYAVCSLLSAAVIPLVERPTIATLVDAAVPILYGGLMSVGVAYTLQVVAQRRAPPAHAAILLSLESLFAGIGGWLVLGERLSPRGIAGCGLMLAGMLCTQLPALAGSSRDPRTAS